MNERGRWKSSDNCVAKKLDLKVRHSAATTCCKQFENTASMKDEVLNVLWSDFAGGLSLGMCVDTGVNTTKLFDDLLLTQDMLQTI